jgi:hypothetical protein
MTCLSDTRALRSRKDSSTSSKNEYFVPDQGVRCGPCAPCALVKRNKDSRTTQQHQRPAAEQHSEISSGPHLRPSRFPAVPGRCSNRLIVRDFFLLLKNHGLNLSLHFISRRDNHGNPKRGVSNPPPESNRPLSPRRREVTERKACHVLATPSPSTALSPP